MINLRIKQPKSLVFLLLFLVCGCSSEYRFSASATPRMTDTTKTSAALPTSLSTIELTRTVTPLPSHTPLQTLILIPTIEPSPTWTPLPTLSPEDANTFVTELLIDNGGCRLPCWWGIIPGETTWETAMYFFKSFATRVSEGSLIPVQIDGKDSPVTGYGVRYRVHGQLQEGSINLFVAQGPIYKIVVAPTGTELSYQLHHLLTSYGQPEEVWLQGWPYNEEHVPHFALLVLYPSKGIAARYEGISDFTTGIQNMSICPLGTGPTLILWDPKQENQAAFMQALMENENKVWGAPYFRPIDVATDLDISKFYERMLDSQPCFETPVKTWDEWIYFAPGTSIPTTAPTP